MSKDRHSEREPQNVAPDPVPQDEFDIAGALLDATGEGVLGVSATGVCAFANKAAARLLGYDGPQALQGLDLHRLVHHSTADGRPHPIEDCRICAALREGRDIAGEAETFWRADGSPMPVSFRARPLRSKNGTTDGILVTFSDDSRRIALESALRQYRRLYDNSRDGCASSDLDGRFLDFNARFLEIVGYSAEELRGLTYLDITPAVWHERNKEMLRTEVAEKGFCAPYQKEYVRPDGTVVPVEIQVYLNRDESGRQIGYWSTIRDISVRKRGEREIHKLSAVVEQNSAIVVITDTSGRIEYVNPKFETSSGYTAAEAIGQNPRILKSGFVTNDSYREMWRAITSGKEWRGELQNRRKDGSLYWESARIFPLHDENGHITNYVAVKEDITAHKAMEDKLFRQTFYDGLTGLPNRTLAFDRLSDRIDRARRTSERLGLLLVNIDGFSRVNSEIGPEAGDRVLAEVARRLAECCHDDAALLARVGGDRFLMAIEGFRLSASLELMARTVLMTLRQPFQTGSGPEIVLSGTIGITVFPNDGDSVESLVRNAESAVQRARRIGRNTYRFFVGSKTPDRSLHMDLLLQGALERDELFLEYQPIFCVAGESCCGAEALIRWQSPELGRIGPGEFVPLFEDCELAHSIGGWILDESVTRLAEWRKASGEDVFISINISPRQLRRTDFVDSVANALLRADVPPHALKLEITERLFVESRAEVLGVLEALNELGVILTLDDFGTGYSALGSLHKLPIRGLKIDRSFVEKISKNSREAAIVRSIQHLCRQMDIMTVAEGIETPEQAARLGEIGVGYIQGFLFSRPISWNRLIEGDYAPNAGSPPTSRRQVEGA